MAVGKEVVSAYSGAADVDSFIDTTKVSEVKTHKIVYSENENFLYNLYADVREIREEDTATEKMILTIFNTTKDKFPQDWLLPLELYEVALQNNYTIQEEILMYLNSLQKNEKYYKLIQNGLDILENKFINH